MAKEGQKQEAARQELIGELMSLRAANLKKNNEPRADAVPQELVRIKEIETELGIEPNAGMNIERPSTIPKEQPPEPATMGPPVGETDAEKLKRLERENAELKAKQARSREAAKIKSVDKKIGYVKRPDEVMNEALAIAEDTDPANWADNIKLGVERMIRRFVRKGGSRKNFKGEFYDLPAGFKKGISFEKKVYALDLLEKLGRIESAEDIIKLIEDRKSLKASAKRQTAKEFNQQLENLGVAWDDSIQVPGMSQTLRS